ncbi:hypothetical protein [Hyphomicrobium sp. CS1GBMeth3]|nr:hypothetical protein [Hyphomicrobium sp. CS1GBMeth3]
MDVLALIILIGGAFAIAVVASNVHFGKPRRRDDNKSDRDP